MSEAGNIEQHADKVTAIQQAAEELTTRLKALADTLASRTDARRMPYVPGRVGQLLRRQSPPGYLIDPVSLKVLLDDGRLWSYSRSESTRFPNGRHSDARVDYPEFAGGRSFPGGREFVFLGAVLDKYSFGWGAPGDLDGEADSAGLRAIYGEGRLVRWVTADAAFTALADAAISRNS